MTIPDLQIRTLDSDEIVKESFLNLGVYLYEGACFENCRWGWRKIDRGELGSPQLERCELLLLIKEEIETRLTIGESNCSIKGTLSHIKLFIQFLEERRLSFHPDLLIDNYLAYSEHLFAKSNKKSATFNKQSAYTYSVTLSNFFGSILGIPQAERLINRTRLKFQNKRKKAMGKREEKQNLEDTFKMGSFLTSLIAGITKESVYGQMPLTIQMQKELVPNDELTLYVSITNLEWPSKPRSEWIKSQRKHYPRYKASRAPVINIEGTYRWRLVNLRICAEFLRFIAQTGMNYTQAKNLERGTYKYKALGDSWEVNSYKKRRGGEVRFRIYKSYKACLEQHISFINHFFPDSKYLFPVFDHTGIESKVRESIRGTIVRNLCKDNNIPWVTPQELRKTRINWLLRRSGDEDLTVEMAQHTKEVLRDKYELPSQQRAMVEITQFWNKHDPIKQGELRGSLIGNSPCNGKPEAIDTKPDTVVDPNCVNPSGCLWCKNHRDRDAKDYVWSLSSLRYLKSIEASVTLTSDSVPADHIVDRLTQKIEWFQQSNKERAKWVTESGQKIEEGEYHPNWAPIIEFLE